MHEMAICETLVSLIESEARAQGIKNVKRARLRVGKMAAFELSALIICLKGMPQRGLLKDTSFEVEEVPVRLKCRLCGETAVDERFEDAGFAHSIAHAPEFYMPLPCPSCGASSSEIVSGREREVASVE